MLLIVIVVSSLFTFLPSAQACSGCGTGCGWTPQITIPPLCDKCEQITPRYVVSPGGPKQEGDADCGLYYTGFYIPLVGCGSWILTNSCGGNFAYDC